MKMIVLGAALLLAGDAYAGWSNKADKLKKEMKKELGAVTDPGNRQVLDALIDCAAPKFVKLMDKFQCEDDGKSVSTSLEKCIKAQPTAALDDAVGMQTVLCMQELAQRLGR